MIKNIDMTFIHNIHCVKSVRIQSFSGPHFLSLGLNTESHIQSECGKMRTRKSPNTVTHFSEKLFFPFRVFGLAYQLFHSLLSKSTQDKIYIHLLQSQKNVYKEKGPKRSLECIMN